MDKIPKKFSNFKCFQRFVVEDPKGSDMNVILGSHKFMIEVIRKKKESPSNKTLIKIFGSFTKKPIKDYVFSMMGKSIMQEIAVCILQDLATNGPDRAKSLQLVVTEVVNATTSEGKTVKIVDQFGSEDPIDQSFLDEIDSAIFKFKDSSGSSPDVKFASGHGLAAPPYLSPDDDGVFVTPKKKTPRSLSNKEIEVLINPLLTSHIRSTLRIQNSDYRCVVERKSGEI